MNFTKNKLNFFLLKIFLVLIKNELSYKIKKSIVIVKTFKLLLSVTKKVKIISI